MSLSEIEVIKNMNVGQIIYVSCDPITLSRDLKLLSTDYKIKDVNFSYLYFNLCKSILVQKNEIDLIVII